MNIKGNKVHRPFAPATEVQGIYALFQIQRQCSGWIGLFSEKDDDRGIFKIPLIRYNGCESTIQGIGRIDDSEGFSGSENRTEKLNGK